MSIARKKFIYKSKFVFVSPGSTLYFLATYKKSIVSF
jgi:hypothetical protein